MEAEAQPSQEITENCNVNTDLLRGIYAYGYTDSIIQNNELLLTIQEGKDVFVGESELAEKLSYFIAALNKLDPTKNHIQALILLPTRELALSISHLLQRFASFMRGVNIACLIGGRTFRNDIAVLREGVSLVVATPGRLYDLVSRSVCDISQVSFVVVDEHMGFEECLDSLLSLLAKDRQTIVLTHSPQPKAFQFAKRLYQVQPQFVKLKKEIENKT